MRRIATLILLPLTACTIQQQNGGDLRLDPPPLIAGNQWQVTKEVTLKNGDRICTVSAMPSGPST